MRPTTLLKNNTLYWVMRLYDPSDGVTLIDADSTPTVAVRKNGASVADSVTVTKRTSTTGIYDCSYNPASEVEGDQFTLEESATITSVAYQNNWEVMVVAALGTGSGLTAVPWNASWDAEVESEVNDALVAIHLDHLLAVDYDPAAKPGVATALLNELIESDAGVSQFTANALEEVVASIGTGSGLTAVPWNAAWDAEVESEVNDALVAIHLDHLLAVDYDPAAKPGVATALWNEIIGNDAGVSQFTANALELAPNVTISASAPSLVAIDSGGKITIHRGDYTTIAFTGLGTLTGRTGEKIYFTVKRDKDSALTDSTAIIQVTETTGAVRLNGVSYAGTASDGAINVTDASTGSITVIMKSAFTKQLEEAKSLYYDVQLINSSSEPVTLTTGTVNIDSDVTRRQA